MASLQSGWTTSTAAVEGRFHVSARQSQRHDLNLARFLPSRPSTPCNNRANHLHPHHLFTPPIFPKTSMQPLMRPLLHQNRTLLSLSLSALTASMSTKPTSTSTRSADAPTTTTTTPSTPPPASSSSNPPPHWPTNPYTPRHARWPYTPADFTRADPTPDTDFYSAPRYVTHIDEHAIGLLKTYYATTLPRRGRVLDFCSSWISHFPPALEEAATTRAVASTGRRQEGPATGDGQDREEGRKTELEVIGLGLSAAELAANPILAHRVTHDLNAAPTLPPSVPADLDAATCVVSIDYLKSPLAVLSSVRRRMKIGGTVHLVVSNRCFPSKVVGRWLRISEDERLGMVGDYLWWSGWREVEVVVLCVGRGAEGGGWFGFGAGRVDPLWVVRGVNTGVGFEGVVGGGEDGGGEGRVKLRDEL